MSGGFDKSVAIWDVGEGYLKHSLKVPMPASDRASELCSLVIPCGVVDAGGTADLDIACGADTPVGKGKQITDSVSEMEKPQWAMW